MAGKGYFICSGKVIHILVYNILDGETVQSFAEKTRCEKCGAKIDWYEE